MTKLGAVFVPQLPPERLKSFMRAADLSGLDEVWLWEDCFLESGVATAAAPQIPAGGVGLGGGGRYKPRRAADAGRSRP